MDFLADGLTQNKRAGECFGRCAHWVIGLAEETMATPLRRYWVASIMQGIKMACTERLRAEPATFSSMMVYLSICRLRI